MQIQKKNSYASAFMSVIAQMHTWKGQKRREKMKMVPVKGINVEKLSLQAGGKEADTVM